MKFRYSARTLLVLVTIVGVTLGLLGREFSQAYREQAAYRELCRRGARGDDWPGWKEVFLGRRHAPIVQIILPASLPLDEALPHLGHLDNLESVEVYAHRIDVDDLSALSELDWIDSLRLSSTELTDDAVPQLAQFHHLRWLYLDNTALTDSGFDRLQIALPECTIER